MYQYALVTDYGTSELHFDTRESVFYPTDTTKLLIEAARLSLDRPKKILDLGCGCGITGLTLAKAGLCRIPLYASDISEEAVALANENARKMAVPYVARPGALFQPWREEKFDVIVDDVSGISDDIARISPWYPEGVACNAGRDGTQWILQVIEQAPGHLTEGGMLIFPVLSLSNEGKIIQALKQAFSSFTLVLKKDWFLPKEIEVRDDILTPLINEGSINCVKKFGRWIWSTSVYRAFY